MSHQHLKAYDKVDPNVARLYVGGYRGEVLHVLKMLRDMPEHRRTTDGICCNLYLNIDALHGFCPYTFVTLATGLQHEADNGGGSYPIRESKSDPLGDYDPLWEGDQLAARLELLDELIVALED